MSYICRQFGTAICMPDLSWLCFKTLTQTRNLCTHTNWLMLFPSDEQFISSFLSLSSFYFMNIHSCIWLLFVPRHQTHFQSSPSIAASSCKPSATRTSLIGCTPSTHSWPAQSDLSSPGVWPPSSRCKRLGPLTRLAVPSRPGPV